MDIPPRLMDVTMRALNAAHRGVLALSRGRLGGNLVGMRVVKVTTTGRVSGQPRSVLLTAPVHDGDTSFVFVASKGGDHRHPDWYLNLLAEPEFVAQPGGVGAPIRMVARTASPEEKAELWPQILAVYKHYDGYERRAGRDIPVVIAEPSTS